MVGQSKPSYGELLRTRRTRAGMSQESLAALSGVSVRTVRKCESEQAKPRMSTLRLLAEALRLDDDERDALLAAALPAEEDDAAAPEAIGFPVPRQLPAVPRGFVGRSDALAQLTTADASLFVITAAGGAGKSWLALRWGHANADRFPDGQLYLNLRGFEPDADPIGTDEALRHLLHSLGVGYEAMPTGDDSRAALFRSLTADKRMLVLLDNAHDAAVVSTLLPAGPECVTLVTSRNALTALSVSHGARFIALPQFSETEAWEAFRSHVSADIVDGNREVAAELVGYCGGLPLAIGVLGAQVTMRPETDLPQLLVELRDESSRLDALEAEELAMNLRAVFDSSCRRLSGAAAEMFVLLGLIPASFSLAAAASLAGLAVPDVRVSLRELETAHLVEPIAPDRYRLHDLTHLYATELARATCPRDIELDALVRYVDHYVTTSLYGEQLLSGYPGAAKVIDPASGTVTGDLRDIEEAVDWFRVENRNILDSLETAYRLGWSDRVWRQARGLVTVYRWFDSNVDYMRVWRMAHDITYHSSPYYKARSCLGLGQAYMHGGHLAEAVDSLWQAWLISEQERDYEVMIGANFVLSMVRRMQGDAESGLEHVVKAANIAAEAVEAEQGEEAVSMRYRYAEAWNSLGWSRALLGQYRQAERDCREALRAAESVGAEQIVAVTVDSLGHIAFQCGSYDEAHGYFARMIAIYQRLSSRHRFLYRAYDQLGDTLAAQRDEEAARENWRRAAAGYRAINRAAEAEAVESKLAAD